MRKCLQILACICVVVLLSGCGERSEPAAAKPNEGTEAEKPKETDSQAEEQSLEDLLVGISMPENETDRWKEDAESICAQLEAEGYRVEVAFSENSAKEQSAQIKQFIRDGASCIVVAAAKPAKLKKACSLAKRAGIPVVSYDRLILGTDAVSYYVAFDSRQAGSDAGNRIAGKAGLDSLDDGAHRTIEFYMGDPKDENARLFYEGMMEVLKPYLDDGRLQCNSGRVSLEETGISTDSINKARRRCRTVLSEYYEDEDLDILASAYDGFSVECVKELRRAGYTVDNWPLISGQEAKPLSCSYILEGTQDFTVLKDSRILAQRCASLVGWLCQGQEPEIPKVEAFDNQKSQVPAWLCETKLVTRENLQKDVIDTGYYSKAQITEAGE